MRRLTIAWRLAKWRRKFVPTVAGFGRDDIEVTVPNSVIGASRIVNEAGGPSTRQRVRIKVSCAYGSDIDRVREVLAGCACDIPDVCAEPGPEVCLVELGESGLVVAQRSGSRRYYRPNPVGLARLHSDLERFWKRALDAYEVAVERKG